MTGEKSSMLTSASSAFEKCVTCEAIFRGSKCGHSPALSCDEEYFGVVQKEAGRDVEFIGCNLQLDQFARGALGQLSLVYHTRDEMVG